MLAMKEAMNKAGDKYVWRARLYTLMQEAIGLARTLGDDWRAVGERVERDMQGKRGEGQLRGADKAGQRLPSAPPTHDRGGGHLDGARGGQTPAAPAAVASRDGAGLGRSAGKANDFVPAPSPTRLRAERESRYVVTLSLLETYTLRGEPIGRMSWGRMCSIETTNLREAAVIARIRAKVANPDQTKTVGEYITAADLTQILAETNSHAA